MNQALHCHFATVIAGKEAALQALWLVASGGLLVAALAARLESGAVCHACRRGKLPATPNFGNANARCSNLRPEASGTRSLPRRAKKC